MLTNRLLINSKRLRLCLLALGVSNAFGSMAMANPDDSLLLLSPATKEPESVLTLDDRQEVSLLKSLDETQSPSLVELPNETSIAPNSSSDDSASTQLLQQRFANGKLKVERYVTEDAEGNLVNHGLYKEYDLSGALIRSGSYINGYLDGAWTQTVSPEIVQSLSPKLDPGFRAPFKSEATFVDGKAHGDWTVTDSKGSPVFLWQFDQGTRDGVSTWFDSRQTVLLEIAYADGIPNGHSTQIVQGQSEPKVVVFDQGRIVETKTEWYEKGKKRSEEMYLAPAAKKLVSHDWWNSTVVAESLPEVAAVRHGRYTAWHPNGQKSFEGNFDSGKPSGEFQWWYANGQVHSKGRYENGNCLGSWVWYHPNGMKMMEGSYVDGVQAGQWSSWSEEGQLAMRAPGFEFPLVNQDLNLEPIVVAKAPSRPSTKVKPAVRRVSTTKKR